MPLVFRGCKAEGERLEKLGGRKLYLQKADEHHESCLTMQVVEGNELAWTDRYDEPASCR